MRSVSLNADGLTNQSFRNGVADRALLANDKARWGSIIWNCEIERFSIVGTVGERGRRGVGFAFRERIYDRIPPSRLNCARDGKRVAYSAGEIDVETRQRTVRRKKIEWRIVVFGHEAQQLYSAQIRFFSSVVGIPEIGRLGGDRRRSECKKRREREQAGPPFDEIWDSQEQAHRANLNSLDAGISIMSLIRAILFRSSCISRSRQTVLARGYETRKGAQGSVAAGPLSRPSD
jgi:hypothetical protein